MGTLHPRHPRFEVTMDRMGELLEEIQHDELVRIVLAQTEVQAKTQAQLSELILQVSQIASQQQQNTRDLDRLTNWQVWGIRLVLSFLVLLILGSILSEAVGGISVPTP